MRIALNQRVQGSSPWGVTRQKRPDARKCLSPTLIWPLSHSANRRPDTRADTLSLPGAQNRVHRVGDFPLSGVVQVPVGIRGEGDLRVSELVHDVAQPHPLR